MESGVIRHGGTWGHLGPCRVVSKYRGGVGRLTLLENQTIVFRFVLVLVLVLADALVTVTAPSLNCFRIVSWISNTRVKNQKASLD